MVVKQRRRQNFPESSAARIFPCALILSFFSLLCARPECSLHINEEL